MLSWIISDYRNVLIALGIAGAIGAGSVALINVTVLHDDGCHLLLERMEKEQAATNEMRRKDAEARKRLLGR